MTDTGQNATTALAAALAQTQIARTWTEDHEDEATAILAALDDAGYTLTRKHQYIAPGEATIAGWREAHDEPMENVSLPLAPQRVSVEEDELERLRRIEAAAREAVRLDADTATPVQPWIDLIRAANQRLRTAIESQSGAE